VINDPAVQRSTTRAHFSACQASCSGNLLPGSSYKPEQADGKNLTRNPMTLRDKTTLGMSLPHRSPDPLALTTIGTVARRAEELGFQELWVTENTVDDGTCLDPVVALTFAASITKRIGLGAAVIVLPIHHPLMVAHQWATLDFISGGRAPLGARPGREHHYKEVRAPPAHRVAR